MMSYSIDLRKKVLEFIAGGGTQLAAAQHFNINPKTIYRWQQREDLHPTPRKSWTGKINKEDLIQHVKEHPDMILRERAAHFGVHVNAIWYAFQRLGIVKKTDALHRTKVYKTD